MSPQRRRLIAACVPARQPAAENCLYVGESCACRAAIVSRSPSPRRRWAPPGAAGSGAGGGAGSGARRCRLHRGDTDLALYRQRRGMPNERTNHRRHVHEPNRCGGRRAGLSVSPTARPVAVPTGAGSALNRHRLLAPPNTQRNLQARFNHAITGQRRCASLRVRRNETGPVTCREARLRAAQPSRPRRSLPGILARGSEPVRSPALLLRPASATARR